MRLPLGARLFPYTTLFRSDRLVVDDILDTENVRTQEARDELDNWYKDVVIGMLVTGSKRIVVGTAFHPDDQLHRWAKTDRKSTRLNSSHRCISYAVFCLKK